MRSYISRQLAAAGQMEITQHFRHALKTWSFWDPDVAGPTPRTGRQPTCTFTTRHLDTIVILAGWAHEVISVPIPRRELLQDPATSIPGWKGPDTFSFMVGVQMHEVRPQERGERDDREREEREQQQQQQQQPQPAGWLAGRV